MTWGYGQPMADKGLFRGMRFSRQVLLLQIGVVVLVLGIGVALVTWLLRSTLDDQYGQPTWTRDLAAQARDSREALAEALPTLGTRSK